MNDDSISFLWRWLISYLFCGFLQIGPKQKQEPKKHAEWNELDNDLMGKENERKEEPAAGKH